MSKQKIILIAVVVILLAGNVFLGCNYFYAQKQLQIIDQRLKVQQRNIEIATFTKLFIEKVLKAETEVSFEDRLKLENAVRDLNDDNVLKQWEKFTSSKTEPEAQEAVKNLLDVLVEKFLY
jgi:L-cysteine desulfidase